MVDRVSAFLLYLVVVVAVCVGSSGWSRNQTISEDSTRSHDDFGFWITLISPTQRLLAQRTCTTLAPHNDDRGVFFSFFSLLMITYRVPTNKNNNYDDRYRSWHNLLDYYPSLTRARLEELYQDLFRRTLDPVEKVLRDSKIDKSNIHDIISVGGSTRIPGIVKLVPDFFNSREPNKSINSPRRPNSPAHFDTALLLIQDQGLHRGKGGLHWCGYFRLNCGI